MSPRTQIDGRAAARMRLEGDTWRQIGERLAWREGRVSAFRAKNVAIAAKPFLSDIIVADRAMTAETCKFLADFWTENPDLREANHEEYWAGRLIGYASAKQASATVAADMRAAATWAIFEVRRVYRCAPLYVCAAHLTGWPEGIELPPHVDDAEPHVRHHHFSAIFYLTSDHEGGELYFPRQGIEIEAKRGRFVSAPCGPSHEHGVRMITKGTRITLAFFLTHDPRHAFRLMHPELSNV